MGPSLSSHSSLHPPTAVYCTAPFSPRLFTVAHVHSRSLCNHRPPSSAIVPLRRLPPPDSTMHWAIVRFICLPLTVTPVCQPYSTLRTSYALIAFPTLIRVTPSPFVRHAINSAYSCNKSPCASIMILYIIEPFFASFVLDRVISSIVRSYSGMMSPDSFQLMDPPSLPTPVPPPLRPTTYSIRSHKTSKGSPHRASGHALE